MIRNKTFYNKVVVDQWVIFHVGLFFILSTTPYNWKNSFGACNLYPRTIVPFPEWYKKIEHFLWAGYTFKNEAQIDLYVLLPVTW